MAPPHYEMVFQQYDELCTVYGMICSVDGSRGGDVRRHLKQRRTGGKNGGTVQSVRAPAGSNEARYHRPAPLDRRAPGPDGPGAFLTVCGSFVPRTRPARLA